jgi:hypothetical protein
MPVETVRILRVRISRRPCPRPVSRVASGDGSPGQSGKLLVQGGLVGFDGQDPVAAFGEVGDVGTLAVQCVDSHDRVAQVADLVEQRARSG